MERKARRRRAEALDRFWDDLIARGAVERPDDVGEAHAQVARWLTELGDVPGLASARERVWARLPHPIDISPSEETSTYPLIALQRSQSPIGPNGRPSALPASLAPSGPFGERRRWATAQLATAALLLITLVASLYVMGPWRLRPGPGLPLVAIQADATPIPASDSDWPTYRGDPARSGVSMSPGPVESPAEFWRFQAGGSINSEPAVVDGVLYVGSDDGNLYAFDARTGAERWRFAADSALSSSPAVADGVVYVGSGDGTLFAIAVETGAELWTAPGARSNASPVVVDGVVFTGGEDGNLYALDATSGAEIWRAPLGAAASRSTSVAGETVFIGSFDGKLHAFEAATGAPQWQFQTDGGTPTTVAIVDGVVYESTFEGDANALYAIDAATGEERWRFTSETGDAVWLPTVHDGVAYAGSDDGNIYALDAADGQELWRFATGDGVDSSASLASGILYAASHDRNLYALDAASGEELWRFPLDGGASKGPIVHDGVLYLGTDVGTLYAIGEASGDATPTNTGTPAAATDIGPARLLWETRGREDDPVVLPGDIDLDPDGRLWVTDGGNDRFLIFSLDGALIGAWGGPGTGDGEFSFRRDDGSNFSGIEFAPDGSFYVLDAGNHRIQQFAADRSFVRSWGSEGSGEGQFITPAGLALSPRGSLFVVDDTRRDMQEFAADGAFLNAFDGLAADNPNPFFANDLAVDAAGNLYVANTEPDQIDVFDPSGAHVKTIGKGHFTRPLYGVDFDASGRIFTATAAGIDVFDADGSFLATWGAIGGAPGQFVSPAGIAVAGDEVYVADYDGNRVQKFQLLPPLSTETAENAPGAAPGEFLWRTESGSDPLKEVTNLVIAPDGNLWVVDSGNQQVQIFAPDGTHLESWGEAGSEEGQFDLTRPDGEGLSSLAFAPDGGFYVADSNNARVQQFDAERNFVRAWGGRGAGDGQFVEPIDVDVDAQGNVYVIDIKRDDVQVFDSEGTFLRKFAGHGSEEGQLDNTSWGAFDPAGNFWIADTDNARVQQFAPDGTFLRGITSEDLVGEALDDPVVVAFDSTGRMFVAEGWRGLGIHVFDAEGQHQMTLTGDDMGGTRFGGVYGIALDGQGNLYVDDWIENEYSAVQKFQFLPPLAP